MLYKIKHNYNPKLITDIFMSYSGSEKIEFFLNEATRKFFNVPQDYISITFEIHAFFVDGKERCVYSDNVKCYNWNDFSVAKQKCIKEYNVICSLMDSVYPQWEV